MRTVFFLSVFMTLYGSLNSYAFLKPGGPSGSIGDLLDGQIDGIDELATAFQKIKPPYGKCAVNGNHGYYNVFGSVFLSLR